MEYTQEVLTLCLLAVLTNHLNKTGICASSSELSLDVLDVGPNQHHQLSWERELLSPALEIEVSVPFFLQKHPTEQKLQATARLMYHTNHKNQQLNIVSVLLTPQKCSFFPGLVA